AGRCADDAQVVLAGLAGAGRPLGDAQVGAVTGLSADRGGWGVGGLAAARLLAEGTPRGGHRPPHSLLAAAGAPAPAPAERAELHERTAAALEAAGGATLAAEAAGHWQAAGRLAEELPARISAAGAAERVFGYAEAAAHWQRAIDLSRAEPGATGTAG